MGQGMLARSKDRTLIKPWLQGGWGQNTVGAGGNNVGGMAVHSVLHLW